MERDQYAKQDSAPGREMTEREKYERDISILKAKAYAEAKVPANYSRSHETAGNSTTEAPGDPVGSADEEARHLLRKLINTKMTRTDYAQMEAAEAHYLRALFDSLPTKMSHDAAMGLKLLVRSYGNTPIR